MGFEEYKTDSSGSVQKRRREELPRVCLQEAQVPGHCHVRRLCRFARMGRQ